MRKAAFVVAFAAALWLAPGALAAGWCGNGETATDRPDIVTGQHHYPSDIARPGMLYGKILRAPAYGARLKSIDLAPAKAMKDVVVVEEKEFIAFAAPTAFLADQALQAAADTAKWEPAPSQPSSEQLYDHLRQHARGGMPANPFADEVAKAAKSLKQTYLVPYVQRVAECVHTSACGVSLPVDQLGGDFGPRGR